MSIRLRAQGKKNMEGDVKREFKVYGFAFRVPKQITRNPKPELKP